ncbi:hypothetical protein G7072_14735 [Nocardioides sp. HDW12B]|uniref:hypothetical protein n=1 Tax=Nocardioides sp. HDW12B TaxID=2714939 RepID=UPI00140E894C|nr:hypothetical protein [Nocardioides sp. HDW12B]QIK67429.1 hypothetical protein G7072_14735 [Nocardioides sp. HDW12B]
MATLHLHVGAPKSGSTYVQQALHANAPALEAAGTLVPGRRVDHFRLCAWTLDQHTLMPHPRRVRTSARELLDETRAWLAGPGDRSVVISHELFAAATDEQIRRLQEETAGAALRVHYVARPLSRTVPAEWQQAVKGGSSMTLGDFVAGVVDRFDAHPEEQPTIIGESDVVAKFAALHDVTHVVPRWAGRVGAENVTVVTMPRAGSDRTELWRRFLSATGLPTDGLPVPDDARPNVSLGAVEAEVLRRVNALRAPGPGGVSPDGASGAVRRLAHRLVESSPSPVEIVLPEHARDWARRQSERIVAHLESSPCLVVGDPAELLVDESGAATGPLPEDLDAEVLAEAATRTVAALLEEQGPDAPPAPSRA